MYKFGYRYANLPLYYFLFGYVYYVYCSYSMSWVIVLYWGASRKINSGANFKKYPLEEKIICDDFIMVYPVK
jgi:hypothetical protein